MDACGTGIGAVLIQHNHPLAFVSKALGPRNHGLSTYEKEYMAILLVVEQWRSYLQHNEFIICTDHASLAHLTDQRLHTPWQHKVLTKLMGLLTRVNSTNVLDEGLRIGEIGRRMNSKVKSVKQGVYQK
jgi:hypothetical protein